jgi:hypothetical protein
MQYMYTPNEHDGHSISSIYTIAKTTLQFLVKFNIWRSALKVVR